VGRIERFVAKQPRSLRVIVVVVGVAVFALAIVARADLIGMNPALALVAVAVYVVGVSVIAVIWSRRVDTNAERTEPSRQ
jgi:hypothetical protein